MGVAMAAAFTATAVLVVLPAPRSGLRRLRASHAPEPALDRTRDAEARAWPRYVQPWLLTLAAGVAVLALLGGVVGTLAGAGAAIGVRWLRRQRGQMATTQRQLAAELPLAADLLAACLACGAQPAAAADAVADAVGGEIGRELQRATAALRLGGDPEATWMSLTASDVLRPVGRAFARSARTGAALSQMLAQVADDQRRRQRLAAERAARRVGVYAAAPLGLCFLPAFVLLAVVPMIAGLVVTLAL